MSNKKITNAMSVDVEDYFQVSAFESVIDRASWDSLECRVERNTRKALALFGEADIKATFFVLGWVADRYPGLVREIVDNGHELASHGYSHSRITTLDKKQFREEVRASKAILEEIGSVNVKGYRAPSYSIVESTLWAHEILAEEGYRYSSSVYPIKHDLYGIPDASRFRYEIPELGLTEIPVSTIEMYGRNFPCGGGGYFRLFPYRLSRWAIERVNQGEGKPCNFYFHPWELDPDQPRQKKIAVKTRFRHYLNLRRMESRLQHLLKDFSWGTMEEVYLGVTK
ncbi:FIG004655: Polysaccharide deacetylase [hydrothermal vent metagenome]|uniref:FIG004655: Polysaccharide deacetylase n=1 Tax=hydrothermal vent metagenome TaxID=652676 RepID=A0A3B0ZAS8_9ZZZZ